MRRYEEKLDFYERFEAARRKEPHPSIYQERRAWSAAGEPERFHIKTLVAPTPGAEDKWIETEPNRKWWQVWRRKSRWIKADQPFELLALTPELYEASKGFKPSEEQLRYILTGQTMPRGDPIPGKEVRYQHLVTAWQTFKSGKIQLEHPTQEQRMASWQRAGTPQRYTQRAYRDDLGKLLGVSTFTPEDIEELAGFKPSSTEAEWAFRDTRKISPKEQLKTWAREQVAEVIRKEEEEAGLYEELAELRTIRIRKGKDIPATLQIGGIDKLMARRRELENILGEGVDR